MSETKCTQPASRNALPKWLGIALLISLCLNFLAIGAFVTMFWQRGFIRPLPRHADTMTGQAERFGRPEHMGLRNSMGHHLGRGYGRMRHNGHEGLGLGRGVLNPHMLMQFAPEKAAAIRETLQSRRYGMRALREKAIAARAAAADVLTSKGYTPEKFDAALKSVQAADHALEAYVLETVKTSVAKLSPEERRKITDQHADRPPNH